MTEVLDNPLFDDQKVSFAVIRVPFFLMPHYDENKPHIETNRRRLVQKWGGQDGWEQQKHHHNLKGRGQEAGIPHFNLDRLTSNTMASHRLIQHLGKTYGLHVSESIYDLLNEYYFVDGHSLNDRPRLAKVVADKLRSTMLVKNDSTIPAPSEEDLLQFLNSNDGRKEIEAAVRRLKAMDIYGIPQFIINGEIVVGSPKLSDTFIRIFRQIEREQYSNNATIQKTIFAEMLGIDPRIVQQGSHS
mmetsp:Transcript_9551/g.10908  ORF Transcript_9551/g.10908 Transcript_9551/m.10908 type:complete len:244 (+) Transcript_9551:416-1147(+)